MARETIVLSLGGSLICDKKGIRIPFLKKFKTFLEAEIRRGKRFVVVTGGGAVCREYQAALRAVRPDVSKVDLDWLGIEATRLNAELVRRIFGSLCWEEIAGNPKQVLRTEKPIIVGAGFEPGSSSDYDAVVLAGKTNAKVIVNLTNVDAVYDKDPHTHSDAKKITALSWKKFRAMVGNVWEPGKNTPFDPIASRLAEEEGMRVAILDGNKLHNVRKFLRGEKFHGTVIGE